jgi:hypothetical protein
MVPSVSTVKTRPASSVFPCVERVDQVEPGPRHFSGGIDLALSERGFHHPQALIECEPGGSCVPGQHLALLDGGVETESKRGVPRHHWRA